MRPAENVDLEVGHDRAPGQHERLGRPDAPLRPPAVRGCEHLLGREVRYVRTTPGGLVPGRHPTRLREQPDGQVRAGPAKANGIEPSLVQETGAPLKGLDVRAPGGDRIGLIEPYRRPDGLPEPGEVRLAEDLLRPSGSRKGDDRPRHRTLVELIPIRSAKLGHYRLRDAARVEAGEEVRIGLAHDADERRSPLRLLGHALHCPGGSPADRLLRGELDLCTAQVDIAVAGIDPPGALRVGGTRERADERRVLEVGKDGQILPVLDVHADTQRKPGVLLELAGPLRPEAVHVHLGRDAIGRSRLDLIR